jgi:MFS superfamily sulfate permease-like transporter
LLICCQYDAGDADDRPAGSGVGIGLLLEVALHLKNGAPFKSLFRSILSETKDEDTLTIEVRDSAIFTNSLGLNNRLRSIDDSIRRVVIDFENAWVVDHTVLNKLEGTGGRWTDRELVLTGLDNHRGNVGTPAGGKTSGSAGGGIAV